MATPDGKIFHRMVGEHYSEGMACPGCFSDESMQKIKKMDFRDDDVLIATYPKAGTTWMQEIVWLLLNDCDTETARKFNINDRYPFLEIFSQKSSEPAVDVAVRMPSPRRMKTHLRPYFFEKGLENTSMKCVVVMRNLKDNLVSLYHFYRNLPLLGQFQGSFSEFFELFKLKHLHGGDWFDFNLDWWSLRENKNIHFAKYEDMKADIRSEIRKLAGFFEVPVTDEQIEIIVQHTSFDSMKGNPSVNRATLTGKNFFMRKGVTGDWINYFTPQEAEYVDELVKEKLTGTGLSFEDTS